MSGDGQTVAQHQRTAAPLQIQLVDGKLGNAIAGVPVSFFSGTPGVYIAPLAVQTDVFGKASWNGGLHSAGTVIVSASVTGMPVVNFTTIVTPAGHRFDGDYVLTATVSRPPVMNPIVLQIADRAVSEPQLVLSGKLLQVGTFDEATGSLNLSRKPCGTVCSLDTLAGTLTLDPEGKVVGTGTVVQDQDDIFGNAGLIGTWSIERM